MAVGGPVTTVTTMTPKARPSGPARGPKTHPGPSADPAPAPDLRHAALAVVLSLLVLPLAGCVQPGADDGGGGEDTVIPDYREAKSGCGTGDEFNPRVGRILRPNTSRRTWCWENGNASAEGQVVFYMRWIREQGQGTFELTIWDGANETFYHQKGPAPNFACWDPNTGGKMAPPGNWTVDMRWWNATGWPTLNLEKGHHDADEWGCTGF